MDARNFNHALHETAAAISHNHMSDADLNLLIQDLQQNLWYAGITMLNGMLCNLGHHIPCEHIRESLRQIDPVHSIF